MTTQSTLILGMIAMKHVPKERTWKYSKRAGVEMKMLSEAGRPYPNPIPECWKEYL